MRKVNYWKTLLVVLCTGCIFAACGDDEDENPFTGVDNNFLSFSLESNENVWKATIIDNEITVTVPEGTSLDGAQASYTLSEQATVNPNPSSVTAWGEEQQFTVTSYNGTTRTYKYTVRYSAVSEIGTFILNSQADVDALADHHVTVIEGSLSIATVENTEDPVINLNRLAKITEVMDDITIGQYYKGENLAGLAKLEKVGSISMRNNSSLTEFALPNLLSIRGELFIANPAENNITSIKCPQLTTILKQCYIQAPNLKSLNLNSLESIPGKGDNSDGDGTFSLYGSQLVSLDLPVLKQVGKKFTLSLGTKHPELTQINLPELISCKEVSIGYADKLETISLPKLSTLSSFSITSCAKFSKLNETIAPSNLEKLSVSHCPSVTELDASQKDINSISITYVDNNFVLKGKEEMGSYAFTGYQLPKTEGISTFASLTVTTPLTNVELSGIKQVTGELSFQATANVTLESVSMPDLETVGKFATGNDNKRCNFPKLTRVTERLYINIEKTVTDLSYLNFKSLESVEFLEMYGSRNTNITSLEDLLPKLKSSNRISIRLFTALYDFSLFKDIADAMTEDAQWYVRTCGPGTVTLQQMQESATGDFTPDN